MRAGGAERCGSHFSESPLSDTSDWPLRVAKTRSRRPPPAIRDRETPPVFTTAIICMSACVARHVPLTATTATAAGGMTSSSRSTTHDALRRARRSCSHSADIRK